jgi:acetylornithine/succinyldiaminopimelate/putrescine aminotransferase
VWSQGNQSRPPKTKQQQAKAQELGSYLQAGFKGLMAKHEVIGDVRGLGMMLGIELVTDRWVLVGMLCEPLPPPFGR